jgi:hypothetical protein
MADPEKQDIIIKSGSGKNPDFALQADLNDTLLHLKKLLQEKYPGNPTPERQTASNFAAPCASCARFANTIPSGVVVTHHQLLSSHLNPLPMLLRNQFRAVLSASRVWTPCWQVLSFDDIRPLRHSSILKMPCLPN